MEPTDIQLMLRVRDGDVAAFRMLAGRYREPLRRYFASLIADRSQADDCAQETLLRVWTAREQYEPTGKFSSYVFQIGTRYWLNQRKRFRLEPCDLSGQTLNAVRAPRAAEPESIALERLRRERIRRAVAALPKLYHEVFRLCHEEGLRYAEIAARMDIPVGTVKSRMAEALKRLRRSLSPREEL